MRYLTDKQHLSLAMARMRAGMIRHRATSPQPPWKRARPACYPRASWLRFHPRLGARQRYAMLISPTSADHIADRARRNAVLSGNLPKGLTVPLPLQDATDLLISDGPRPTYRAEHVYISSTAQAGFACAAGGRMPQRSCQRVRRFGGERAPRALTARTACHPDRAGRLQPARHEWWTFSAVGASNIRGATHPRGTGDCTGAAGNDPYHN